MAGRKHDADRDARLPAQDALGRALIALGNARNLSRRLAPKQLGDRSKLSRDNSVPMGTSLSLVSGCDGRAAR
jgi:hypothetical protein